MPSRCQVTTVAGADRTLQGTTAHSHPQCRCLLAADLFCPLPQSKMEALHELTMRVLRYHPISS